MIQNENYCTKHTKQNLFFAPLLRKTQFEKLYKHVIIYLEHLKGLHFHMEKDEIIIP